MQVLEYFQPASISEAVTCLNKSPETTRILAGGTDLILQLRNRTVRADYLVDLSKIAELKTIIPQAGELLIGSMVTFAELQQDPLVREYVPILAQAAGSVGSPQIRNTATIGGNVANAAPAADSLPPLLAMEARVRLESPSGRKEVRLQDILGEANKTLIAANQVLTQIVIPLPPKNTCTFFIKLGRRKALAIARLSLALSLNLATDGTMEKTALALGAVGFSAYRVHQVEQLLNGKHLTTEQMDAARDLVSRVVAERLGARSTAVYKSTIAGAALLKALKTIRAQLGGC